MFWLYFLAFCKPEENLKKITPFLKQSRLVFLINFFYIWPNESFWPHKHYCINFVRFKAFLTVNMKIWLWYIGHLPPSCTLPYRLHNVTCHQTAAAYHTVQMFTPLQNAVTKQWIVNSWCIATYLPYAVWFITYHLVKLQSFSEQLLKIKLCK